MEMSEKVDLILRKLKPITVNPDLHRKIDDVCYTLDEYYGFVDYDSFIRCIQIYNMLCDGGYEEDMRL